MFSHYLKFLGIITPLVLVWLNISFLRTIPTTFLSCFSYSGLNCLIVSQSRSKGARARGISQRAVYPIAKKIADRGIKPTNVVDKTYKETIKQFKPVYENHLKDIVGVVLKNDIFNQTNTKGVIIPKNLR